jgi:hypothetical protein
VLGVIWLNFAHHFWDWWPNFAMFFLIFALILRFFLFEAYEVPPLSQRLAYCWSRP